MLVSSYMLTMYEQTLGGDKSFEFVCDHLREIVSRGSIFEYILLITFDVLEFLNQSRMCMSEYDQIWGASCLRTRSVLTIYPFVIVFIFNPIGFSYIELGSTGPSLVDEGLGPGV